MESRCSSFQLNLMRMKMAAVATITVLLFCCCVPSADSQASCDYDVVAGGSFSVPVEQAVKDGETVRWKYNDKVIFDKRPDKIIFGKEEDIHKNGSLKVVNMDKSKVGKYTVEILQNGQGVRQPKNTYLCVIDPVPKPDVTFKCLSYDVTFTCKAPKDKYNKLEWLQGNKVQQVNSVTLKKKVEDMQMAVICRVFNKVSHADSTPVKHNCTIPHEGFSFPEKLLGIDSWIILTGIGGVLVLIIIVIVSLVCTRRKQRMRQKNEDELRLKFRTNPHEHHCHPLEQQPHPPNQHPQHHHHHPQQPAGHTGPRQHRSRQPQGQPRPRAPDVPGNHPQAGHKKPPQVAGAEDDEQPPPLPKPRKKAPKTQRV